MNYGFGAYRQSDTRRIILLCDVTISSRGAVCDTAYDSARIDVVCVLVHDDCRVNAHDFGLSVISSIKHVCESGKNTVPVIVHGGRMTFDGGRRGMANTKTQKRSQMKGKKDIRPLPSS